MLTSDLHALVAPAEPLWRDYAARRAELAASEKSAGQFVTEADEAIEERIRAAIRERFGDVPVIGEERGGGLGSDASGWAIDPIDGTSNFLRGLPMWAVSVGLLDRGVSVAGIVVLPDLGLTLAAVADGGLELNGAPFVRPQRPPGGAVLALGENDFESGARTDARAEGFRSRGYAVVRYRCAVFSLASAALGRIDGYVEHGCRIWDVAAGSILCRKAGLAVAVDPLGDERVAIEAIAPGGPGAT